MRGYTSPPESTSLTCFAVSLTYSGGNSAAVLFGYGPRAGALQGAAGGVLFVPGIQK